MDDIFIKVLEYAALGIKGWGAVMAIVGIINFSEGHSQQNAAKKEEGMGKIVGGGVIFVVGLAFVSMLSPMFSI